MRQTTKRRVQRLEDNKLDKSDYLELVDFINWQLISNFNKLEADYQRLKRHISNNGLWRMVKQLRADFDELRGHIAVMVTEHDRKFRELESNGVATAINKLNKEVFGETKNTGSDMERVMAHMAGFDMGVEPTLAAKVDAIIEHLGIEVSATPAKVTETPAKVSVKKAKKATKKGRK